MERIYLALAALVGGLLVSLAGYWESHEVFDLRKFGASAIRLFIAGVIFAVGYQFSGSLNILDILIAFITGTTFEVVVKRIAGALGNPYFPLRYPK